MDDHDYVPPRKDPVSENDSMSDIEVVPPMQGASQQPDILKGKSGKPKKKKQKTRVISLLHISCLTILIQLSRLLQEVRSPKVRLM